MPRKTPTCPTYPVTLPSGKIARVSVPDCEHDEDPIAIESKVCTSEYGNWMASLKLNAPRNMHHRKVAAILHRVIAAVEEATPTAETWAVELRHIGDTYGIIAIETVSGERPEAERGLKVLQYVAESIGGLR